MDSQGRLTRKDEWIVGKKYHWKKGRYTNPKPITFLGFGNDGGIFIRHEDGHEPYCLCWRNRFIPAREIQTYEADLAFIRGGWGSK